MLLKFDIGQGVCIVIVTRFLDDLANVIAEVKSANSAYELSQDQRQLKPATLRHQRLDKSNRWTVHC